MNSITILYPLGQIGHPTTGGQVYDYRLFEIINKQGIVIDIIGNGELGWKKDTSIYKLPLKLLSHLKSLGKNQTLIFNTALFPYYIIPFYFLKLLYPKLKLFGIHHHFRFQEQTGIKRKIYKFLEFTNLKQCTAIINPCPYTRDVLLKHWKKGKVINLENSFDCQPKQTSVYQPYKLLYVGSVYERKGIMYLLEAISKIPIEIRNKLTLDIVGGFEENNSYVAKLTQFIADNNLDSIVNLRGRVSDEELMQYYQQAYAFVLPSLLEGYGLVIVEAMSYGLPVIAFNNSAMPYTIKHEINGLLAQDRSILSLKDNILRIITDPSLHKKLSENAKKYSENAYSFTEFKEDTVKFINLWL